VLGVSGSLQQEWGVESPRGPHSQPQLGQQVPGMPETSLKQKCHQEALAVAQA